MTTYIYMVRHGESPKTGYKERERVLTKKGQIDAHRVTELLQAENIDVFVSSPYKRSILTIQELAEVAQKEILVLEDLKVRIFSAQDTRISDKELFPLLERSYSDPHYALPGGESNEECQIRGIKVIKELLHTYQGKKIAIGTHGAIMTLMMGYYDNHYNLKFLLQSSKPDIYRMEFNGQNLVAVARLWDG
ncbi:histidine phosphatase family protein [Heyndrickxia camelliae]|uniref:Histidine phosphatase family protein n=1 Tax=Heyndrickxia camelliae TaxID=1707093 RepID=A0A2N3LDR7_9BACI|nr:histidine phosphatase family protein [Heyndrickxia camelliae]PKR82725.1 histidine phosphatase family protein [Heyndrickxia camelliae]